MDQVINNPAGFGLQNVTVPVWTGNFTDSSSGTLNATGAAQNQYLFFDSLHPTEQGQSLVAGLAEASIPALSSGSPPSGQTQPRTAVSLSNSPLFASDFNGDGKSDILLQNDDGSVAAWEMNGTAIIASALVSPAPASWHVKVTGDFNGDGYSDVVLQNDDGSVAIWEMNGTAIIGSALVSAAPPSWHVVGTGDFNGDNKSDILLQNDDGSVAIWDMNGFTITASALVSPAPASWHVKGTGDYNGDGMSDILLQNDDGAVATWEMNGMAITSSALISTPAASWHAIGSDTMQFINAGSAATVSATSGTDEFVLTSFTAGEHTIAGFDPTQDLIEFSTSNFADFSSVQAHTTASGGGTLITLDNSSSLLIAGVSPTNLQSSNFVFV